MKNTIIITLFLTILLAISVNSYAQEKSRVRSGHIKSKELIQKPYLAEKIAKDKITDNNNLRSSVEYKTLENGYVLESVDYQLYTPSGWIDYQSELNTYDNNFNLIETLTMVFSGTGLENYQRIILTYYWDNKQESETVQYWNGVVWEDDSRTTYEYDNQRRLLTVNYLLPDGPGSFMDYTREVYTYYTNPKKEVIESQQYSNGSWENQSLTEAVYLDEERVQQITTSGWNGSEYQFNERQNFSYNGFILEEIINQLWNGGSWSYSAKQVYSYDGFERITESASFSFNEVTQSWDNVYKLNNYYYGNDSLLTIAQEGAGNSWVNIFKVINYLNIDGKVTEIISFEWDGMEWGPLAKAEQTYDANGNLKLYMEYAYEDNNWTLYGRAIYAYIPANPTNVDDDPVQVVDFKLYDNYPNPFNPSTTISWRTSADSRQTLKIYDVLGNEVATLVDEYRAAGKHSIEFNASGLASGVYVYRITAGTFVESKKMVLMK